MKKLIIAAIISLNAITSVLAERTSDKVDSLKLLLKTVPIDSNRVLVLNSLSEYLINADSYDSALYLAEQSRDLAEKLNFKAGLAISLRIMGISYTCQGEYSKSLTYLFKALKVAESTKDNYIIGKVYNSLGSNYILQEDYSNALNYYLKSMSFYYNPVVYGDIARVYHFQDKDQLAIEFYGRALSDSIPKIERAYILNNIGDVYEKKNNLNVAIDYYFKSLSIMEDLNNDAGICDVNGSIGDLLILQKKYNQAIPYENRSLEIAKKINNKNGVWQSEKSLSEIYEMLGDGAKSLYHYKNYISVRDTMFSQDNIRQNVRTEMNFDFDKKQAIQKAEQDKKDALSKAELERQQTQRNGFVIGMCIVIVFSIFLFRSFRQTQKAKNIIIEQKKLVDHKSKELTDNINYAKNIQLAMLPSNEYIKNNLPENFLIYRPKDIVSGDFYWAFKDDNSTYFATADCTGHGVSGAMLTMIGASLLNEIVIERKITDPDKVLNMLRKEIISSINHENANEERKDGMDIVFCKLSGMTLECAGANNPIYISRNGNIIDVKANRFPVGKFIHESPFTLNTIQLEKGDVIYTLSDGFCDQFSERTGKKLMTKRLKGWISELSGSELPKIKDELETRFNQWMGNSEQIDDVTVFAIKI